MSVLLAALERQPGDVQPIVADGGSTDGTVGGINGRVKVVTGGRGRAGQMNLGAAAADGDVLLFLHADAVLPPGATDRIRDAIRAGAVGGCFLQSFEEGGWPRVFEIFRDFRTRGLGSFYGDNAIFVRRDLFERLGGFAPLPVMEDYDLARRMRRAGPVRVIPDRVASSSRRFQRRGWIRQWWTNQWIKIAYRFRWNLDGLYE